MNESSFRRYRVALSEDDAPPPAWKALWKEELMELKERVQEGRRPSLLEISIALAKKGAAN